MIDEIIISGLHEMLEVLSIPIILCLLIVLFFLESFFLD